eukprot:3516857-Pyramimonas_sp.AAC.1
MKTFRPARQLTTTVTFRFPRSSAPRVSRGCRVVSANVARLTLSVGDGSDALSKMHPMIKCERASFSNGAS